MSKKKIISKELQSLIDKANISNNDNIYHINDDIEIVNYLCDCHDPEIMKKLQNREENAGVMIFYHNKQEKDHLILVIRYKGFEKLKENGLICMVVPFVYNNLLGSALMKKAVKKIFNDNRELKSSILASIESLTTLSINQNNNA